MTGGHDHRAAPDVLVVGAGVSGLTSGICLAESGARVLLVADRMPQDTTSAAAGAIWGLHSTEPGERAARWGRATLAELASLADDPASGVRIRSGVVAIRSAGEPPANLSGLDDVRPCEPGTLPAGFAAGWGYRAPVVHMPTYLGYLRARFQRAGGRMDTAVVTSLAAAARARGARAVVNCAGAGARDLVPDPAVTAVRGQIVVAANPGITDFFIGLPGAGSELVYLFPHADTVVLGGTQDAGNWSLRPDPATGDRILRDCAAIDPRLRRARVLAHRAGLRPVRPRVRLEAETLRPPPPGGGPPGGVLAVHNYGHGGAGVSLSWGCARDVAAALR